MKLSKAAGQFADRWLMRMLPESVRPALRSRVRDTGGHPQWLRLVMDNDAKREFERLGPPGLDVVEISPDPSTTRRDLPWRNYTPLDFPAFDLCNPPEELPGPFGLVICEQVLEHVVDPLRAVKTLRCLCAPDGHVFVSTPFLVRLHAHPGDFWRFTPEGMKVLLRSQGLEPLWVRSWGNRRVIAANFNRWVARLPWQTLRNEPDLPAVVWTLARVDDSDGLGGRQSLL